MITLEKTTIEIGLEKPIKVLHVTDSHIVLWDERDDERKQKIAVKSAAQRSDALDKLKEQIAYAEENCDLLLHTGDWMDFITARNAETARELLKNEIIHFIPGNHDFLMCPGDGWEDMTYRMNSFVKMGDGLGVRMFFTSRIVGGVNFVGIDDVYHQVEEWQLERLQMEVGKGYPIILFMHAPLFEQGLYERSVEYWEDGSAYVLGCDEEHLKDYPDYHYCQQRPTRVTREFVDYVNKEPQIKAVIAGHLHFNYESMLPGGKMQYVTGCGYRGEAREITIK